MSSTHRGAERNRDDYYETPPWVTQHVLDGLALAEFDCVLEPCAGRGAILDVVAGAGFKGEVIAVEVDPDRAAACRVNHPSARVINHDFLTLSPQELALPPDARVLVVTNPPFSHAMEFIRACLPVTAHRGTVAMLLRLAFLESAKRRVFHQENGAHVRILTKRPSFTGDGKTDSVAYAWFLWGDGKPNRWEVL